MSSSEPKFFGLTALGAPCPYNPKLLDTVTCDIFTDDDIEDAFQKAAPFSGQERLRKFFSFLYRGEYRNMELERVSEILVQQESCMADADASLEQIRASLATLKREGAEVQKCREYGKGSGSEFSSNQLYREHRYQHVRYRSGPAEKYSEPLTESQKIGWTAPPEFRSAAFEKHPKKSCAETIYQDELVKSGFAPR